MYTETIELEDGVSDVAEEAERSVIGLADSMGGLSGATGGISDSMGGLESAAGGATEANGGLSDSMGQATSSGEGMQAELAEMTGGLSLLVEAALAGVAAFGALVIAGSATALKFAEATRQMTATFDALGHGKTSGAETIAMLDSLGDSIGQTREKLAPLAQSFMAMGITGTDQIRSLTLAAASADATIAGAGQTFTNTFKKLTASADLGQPFKLGARGAAQLLSMGLSVDDMAQRMGMSATDLGNKLQKGMDPATARKFGTAMQDALIKQGAGPLAALGDSMGSIKAKFVENIGKMFADVAPAAEGFMASIKDLFDIFGQAKPSGQALKSGIGAFFTGVFSIAQKVVPYIKHFLLDLVIYGLKAYIALKPTITQFKALFATSGESGGLTKVLSFVAEVLVAGIQGAVGFAMKVAILVGWLVGLGESITGAVATGIAMFGQLASTIGGFVGDAINALGGFVTGAADVAKNFIAGLVGGISNGAGMVVDAVKGLASSAMGAITGALGIKSPSTVMMGFGAHTAGGFAAGIDAGASDVQASAGGLANAAAKGASAGAPGAAGSPGAGGGGKGDITVTVEPGAIVIQGGGGSAAELTEEAVSMIFERVALGAGL